MNSFKRRLLRYVFRKVQKFKMDLYESISHYEIVVGNPKVNQPVHIEGKGKVYFDENVNLGYYPSPKYFESSIYIEARYENAFIRIGRNTYINNSCAIIADKTSVTIGDNVLIGTNVEIADSDFHHLDPSKRKENSYDCIPVIIENNVFIGSNVKILKGVTIGENSVIGNGSIVNKDIPANVIAAGVPAKVLKSLC